MPSASVQSGNTGNAGAWLKEGVSVEVRYSARYHSQPSQNNIFLYEEVRIAAFPGGHGALQELCLA
jgi:hypothetical protein